MRFLGIGDYCDLSALYLRLLAEGHEVKIHIANPLCQDTLAGLVAHVPDWRAELGWLGESGDEGMMAMPTRGDQAKALTLDEARRIGGEHHQGAELVAAAMIRLMIDRDNRQHHRHAAKLVGKD